MDIQVDVRKAVWSRYWSHGVAHSCGGSYGNRYEGAVAQFWRAACAGLPPGARMLDIATGNGAVPQLLLANTANSIECDAIDLAQPAPQWLAGLSRHKRRRIRFHSQQAAEALCFPDAHFDLVTSQYGLEYTDLSRSLPEILRVLRPGGRVCLLTHHVQARPVRLAFAELDHLDWLLAPGGLLEAGAAMIEPMARAASAAGRASLAGDAAAHAARERFNALQQEATRLAAASACPDVLAEARAALGQILNMAGTEGAHSAQGALSVLAQELADSGVRLRELCAYALDEAGALALAAALGGSAQDIRPLLDNGVLMGWGIQVRPG